MKRVLFYLVVGVAAVGSRAAAQEVERPGHFISRSCVDLVRELAKEESVVEDIEFQNHAAMDEGRVRETQEQWVKSSPASDLVLTYRNKRSAKTMWNYFFKDLLLVDCYTLDSRGRVVGTLYKPGDFIQEDEPRFLYCFNHGEGRDYIAQPDPEPVGRGYTVDISLPVVKDSRTVGVLVATVLLEK